MTCEANASEAVTVPERISHSILRIRSYSPFFGTLALFANHQLTESVPTAATDGRSILFNPKFADCLRDEELDGVMLHEILHAAMLHPQRAGDRDKHLWNIAADIVVNGVVTNEKWASLPRGSITAPELESFTVEEVYVILKKQQQMPDQMSMGILGEDLVEPDVVPDSGGRETSNKQESYWRNAWNQAATLERMRGQGDLPAGLKRLLSQVNAPQMDWQTLLWRFLVRTPVDYCGYDRRHIHRGLYLEELGGEIVRARIAIDTSGSIDGECLAQFIGEIREILRCYPAIDAKLYYADAELYGPHSLESEIKNPSLRGGGGTSFKPFFDAVREEDMEAETVCIYLTDGFGYFPEEPPVGPVLWVVTPGGAHDKGFPFGEVIRFAQ